MLGFLATHVEQRRGFDVDELDVFGFLLVEVADDLA